jgi:hypothetical protein
VSSSEYKHCCEKSNTFCTRFSKSRMKLHATGIVTWKPIILCGVMHKFNTYCVFVLVFFVILSLLHNGICHTMSASMPNQWHSGQFQKFQLCLWKMYFVCTMSTIDYERNIYILLILRCVRVIKNNKNVINLERTTRFWGNPRFLVGFVLLDL